MSSQSAATLAAAPAAAAGAAAGAAAPAAPVVVLVTGGTGLVGRAMEAQVRATADARGERWLFCGSGDGDLRQRAAVIALFERAQPTHVIHLAAFVGGLFKNLRHKVEFYRCACMRRPPLCAAPAACGATAAPPRRARRPSVRAGTTR